VVAAIALFGLTAGAGAVQGDKKIRMYDDCEPNSFNAVLGDGACVGNGHTTFDEFIAELAATQDAHAWRNQPTAMLLNVGRPTFIENRGGETHTFTPVANFGGGFVNELNGISGNPVPAPECLNFGAISFIPAGGSEEGPTAGSSDLPVGSHKFQCCIHPGCAPSSKSLIPDQMRRQHRLLQSTIIDSTTQPLFLSRQACSHMLCVCRENALTHIPHDPNLDHATA
jgi:hypothetical protein